MQLWANQTLGCTTLGIAAGAIQSFLGRGGGVPAPLLCTAYGVNSMALGGIFFALRGLALVGLAQQQPPSPTEARLVSGAMGGVTGMLAWGLAGGGLRRAPVGAALLGSLGLVGQVAFDALEGALAQEAGGAAAVAAAGAGRAGQWRNVAWLPVTLSPAASDEARLAKEKRRLVELDQVLGLVSPTVHPKALELAARERAALERLKNIGNS